MPTCGLCLCLSGRGDQAKPIKSIGMACVGIQVESELEPYRVARVI